LGLPTIEQLTEPQSVDDVLAFLLNQLQQSGIDTTAWGDGTAARDFAFAAAVFFSVRTDITVEIAKGGFLDLATKNMLTLFADSHYDVQRDEAIRTEGYMQLVADDTASLPQDITAGEQVVIDRQSRQTYRIEESGTVDTEGDPVQFFVRAEEAGEAGNIGYDIGTLELQTPINGISVTNQHNYPAQTATDDTWITQAGADEQSDDELRTECRTKWATLAIVAGPHDIYVFWAIKASEAVTRVQVDDQDATGTGKVTVYLAGAQGASDSAVVAAVDKYINGDDAGNPRRAPIGATVTIQPASDMVVALIVTVAARASYVPDINASVKDALENYFKTVDVGGTKVEPLVQEGYVLLGRLQAVANSVEGVINVTFNVTQDIPVPKGYVPTPFLTFASPIPV